MGINHGRPHITVPKQLLNGADVVVGLQQMAGKTVAECMGGCPLGNFGFADGSGNLADEVEISVEADFWPESQ